MPADTRQPPIGWGQGSSNMATIIGNWTLHNTNVSIDALIETPAQGYAPPAEPYVLIGVHGGSGQLGASSPNSFYRQGPDFDFVWLNAGALGRPLVLSCMLGYAHPRSLPAAGSWGCSVAGSGDACAKSFPLPGGFGYDTWHSISVGTSSLSCVGPSRTPLPHSRTVRPSAPRSGRPAR